MLKRGLMWTIKNYDNIVLSELKKHPFFLWFFFYFSINTLKISFQKRKRIDIRTTE